MAGRKWKKGIKCQPGYVDDGKGNCVKVHELNNKYHIKGPTSMPTSSKKPSLSTYDSDYNRKGGKISKYYKAGGNVITGR